MVSLDSSDDSALNGFHTDLLLKGQDAPARPSLAPVADAPKMGGSRLGHSNHWIWHNWDIHYTYEPSRAQTSTGQVSVTAAPVLLLHGFGASVGHWRHNIQPLGSQRSVYALDLLGFGGSAKPQVDYTIDLWVDQVIDFWDTHISQPVVLVGHSVGGLVALLVAARRPEMVKGLCLISCADGPHPEELPAPLEWLVQGLCEVLIGIVGNPLTYPPLFRWLRQPDVLRRWIENVYQNKAAVDEDLVQIFLQPAFDEGAEYVFLDAFRAVLTRRFDSPRRVLPRLKVPILLIWGQQDPAVPSFLADQFKKWQPALTLIKLPGIGHCAHDELPGWVNALIGEWAASLERIGS